MIGKRRTITVPRVLVAVCHHELRSLLRHTLERAAYAVEECASLCGLRAVLTSGMAYAHLGRIDLLLFDQRMLDETAVQMIRDLQHRACCPPLVLVQLWSGESLPEIAGVRVAGVIAAPGDVKKCASLARQLAPHRQQE